MTQTEIVTKWFYYCMNYSLVECFHTILNKPCYVPDVVANAEWHCNRDHMINKWYGAVRRANDPASNIPYFFAELDTTNREIMINWVMENYKG